MQDLNPTVSPGVIISDNYFDLFTMWELAFTIIPALALSLSGCHKSAERQSNDIAPEISVARPALRPVTFSKTYPATLSAARTQLGYCTIRAPFAGRVAKREVDPGSVVSPGTRLTSIYNEDHS